MEDEIAVKVDGWVSPSIYQCRICHEEEEESASKSIEAPCSCSGTVKFAHRECIQRWCDEKGNTTCEICLQKYEPGYTVSPPLPTKQTRLADIAVTIRESLEVPRQNHELPGLLEMVESEDEMVEDDITECSSTSTRSSSFFRSIALIFTTLLIVRHLVSILTGVPDHYAFRILAVVIVRAGGILFPFYIMMQAHEMIHYLRRQRHEQHEAATVPFDEDDEEPPSQHTIQIHQY